MLQRSLLVLAVLWLATPLPAHSLSIDEFGGAFQQVSISQGETIDVSSQPAPALGGFRRLRVFDTFGESSGSVTVSLGRLEYAKEATPSGGGFGIVTWDGGDPQVDGLGGVDLTSGGHSDEFHLSVLSLALGTSFGVTISVGDSQNRSSRAIFQVSAPGLYEVGFSELQADFPEMGPADLTDVVGLSVRFTSTSETAIEFGYLRAVPEPGTAPLVLLGLLALAGPRIRERLDRGRRGIPASRP